MGFPLPSLLSRDYFLRVYNGYSWSWSKSGGFFFLSILVCHFSFYINSVTVVKIRCVISAECA